MARGSWRDGGMVGPAVLASFKGSKVLPSEIVA